MNAWSDGTSDTLEDVVASWSSSNTNVATVSSGNVTGVTAGSTTITASANLPVCGDYYGYSPSCEALQTYATYSGTASLTVIDPTPTITQIMETAPIQQVNTPTTPFTVGTSTTASGSPVYTNHAMFPWYSVYQNGVLLTTITASPISTFVAQNSTYQVTMPPNP